MSPRSRLPHEGDVPHKRLVRTRDDDSPRGGGDDDHERDDQRHRYHRPNYGGNEAIWHYRDGSHRLGIGHRGGPHGTPRHDLRMHGYTTYPHRPYAYRDYYGKHRDYDRYYGRHRYYGSSPRRPGYCYYGRYGYGYRGSSLSIYLGSSSYDSIGSHYDEPYYGVPYYVPYAAPAPYVVEETRMGDAGPVAAPAAVEGAVIQAAEGAAEFQRKAEEAFREHRYEDAARLSNHAIVEDSRNGKLHLFASQVFFALGDFTSAAAAIQQAATLLERDQWGFVVENYQQFYRGDDYVTQMERLHEYLVENPDASYAYFLRGYHFLYLGHKEAARDDLARAVALEGRDLLAAELLKMAGGKVPEAEAVSPPEAELVPPPPGENAAGEPEADS